jgi:diguanylate cyclase (GGDEF)-like protein
MDQAAKRELTKLQRELDIRMAVTSAMLGTLDLQEVLFAILSGITFDEGLGFDRAFLFLDDDSGRSLRIRLALAPSSAEAARQIWRAMERPQLNYAELLPRFAELREDETSVDLVGRLTGFSLPLHRLEQLAAAHHALILSTEATLSSVLARCLLDRAPFCSNSLTLRHGGPGVDGGEIEFRHVAMVPLAVQRRLIGAIVADNLRSGTHVHSEALRSLHALGNLAALAIDRARLHARAVAMAEIDGLTTVYNRRYYEEQARAALEQCSRRGQPISIAVFDLDHFKSVNDLHGHLVGDEVLKDVARILVDSVRQSDLVARYGGEEFVVLLPDTAQDAAINVAEKLRLRIQGASLAGGRVQRLTVSVGVACSQQRDTVEGLFERADRALYQAKREGRNRAIVAQEAGYEGGSPTS